MGDLLPHFLVPCTGVGTYGLAFVSVSVRASGHPVEIWESLHKSFLIFATKLGLFNATEMSFWVFFRKIPFRSFVPFLVYSYYLYNLDGSVALLCGSATRGICRQGYFIAGSDPQNKWKLATPSHQTLVAPVHSVKIYQQFLRKRREF